MPGPQLKETDWLRAAHTTLMYFQPPTRCDLLVLSLFFFLDLRVILWHSEIARTSLHEMVLLFYAVMWFSEENVTFWAKEQVFSWYAWYTVFTGLYELDEQNTRIIIFFVGQKKMKVFFFSFFFFSLENKCINTQRVPRRIKHTRGNFSKVTLSLTRVDVSHWKWHVHLTGQ